MTKEREGNIWRRKISFLWREEKRTRKRWKYFEKENAFFVDKEKEENIWKRKICFWWRRRQTEQNKEEIIWRKKINGDANRPTG